MLLRTALSFSLILQASLFAQTAKAPQGPAKTPATETAPLIVGLETPLDTNNNKLQLNSTVFASALADWKDGNCHLKYGSIVAGHVVALDRHDKQGASVTLLFDHADCDRTNTPIHFMLAAMMAAPPVTLGRGVIDSSDVSVLAGGLASLGGLGGQIKSLGGAQMGMDVYENAAELDLKGRQKKGSDLKVGDVKGIKNVSLQVDQDKDTGSQLTSVKDHLRLEQSTRFLLLVKKPAATPVAKPATTASNGAAVRPGTTSVATKTVAAATPPPPPEPEIDETSICAESCSVVTDDNAMPARASATLATRSLGFLSHDKHLAPVFGFEASLFYLDPNNLLFTYDPHHLRTRAPSGFASEPIRTVRAVLMDSSKLTVKRELDWKVQGEGQYIWHVGNNVLVHMGHNLRLMGPDLQMVREITLPSALVFVSVAPSGNSVLVGTINERHTREMHNEMVESLKEDPVEDVDIQLYDGSFTPMLHASSDTTSPIPVLSDSGEVLLAPSNKKDHYLVTELRWDRTKHTVADLISSCTPSLSTPQAGMVFVTGCKTSSQHWYRMVRLDGHAVLTGYNTNQHFEESFSNNNTNFAVRSIHTHVATATSINAKPEQVTEQEISIYRSTDGKRVFSLVDPGVSFAHQSFALAPGGNQVAVLSGTAISLYPIAKTAQ